MSIGDFHLLRPLWLLALPVVLLVAIALYRIGPGSSDWRKVVDPSLLDAMTTARHGRRKRWLDLAIAVLVFCIVAMSGPSFHKSEREVAQANTARFVLLDISRSMNARDVVPSRMSRARALAGDILEQSRGIRAALIAFAGDAWPVTPLTRDAGTLSTILPVLDPDVAPLQGSQPDRALQRVERMVNHARLKQAEVVLITDGFRGPNTSMTYASRLANAGHRVHVVAVGTEQGATIPLLSGGVVEDFKREPVMAAVNYTALEEIASVGGGSFQTLTGTQELSISFGAGVTDTDSTATKGGETVVTWRDDGPWLLFPALLLAALGFRRGWLLVLPLAAALTVVMPQPAVADMSDLFFRDDQRTAAAFDRGDYEGAENLTDDAHWLGAIRFRQGNFESASNYFGEGDDADAHYNRGTALALADRLPEALAAYEVALERDPVHEDALYNRALVQSVLDKRKQQERERTGDLNDVDSGTSDNNEGSADSGGGQSTSDVQEDGTEPSDEQRSAVADALAGVGDMDMNNADPNATPEYTDTAPMTPTDVETWIKLIPDDPGGYVRRKFQIQQAGRSRATSSGNHAW